MARVTGAAAALDKLPKMIAYIGSVRFIDESLAIDGRFETFNETLAEMKHPLEAAWFPEPKNAGERFP